MAMTTDALLALASEAKDKRAKAARTLKDITALTTRQAKETAEADALEKKLSEAKIDIDKSLNAVAPKTGR